MELIKVHDKEFVVAEIEGGNFFGEFSLLDDEPRSLSITALETTVTGSIGRNEFYQILSEYPVVTRDIIKVILRRLRTQNRKIVEQLRQRQKELEDLVTERTADLRQKNEELEKTLDELKRTQEQLVQQQKLASLGQLTAGIAHEIRNPLNFVNNFSQVSESLIDELLTVTSEEEKAEIISDLRMNLSKIHQHGQRADNIVKNMLDHARTGPGTLQLTDVNQLCEEFLTLAVEAIQSANSDFQCTINRNFENGLPKVEIVPQDIARVLLNLFNNGLYSLKEKSDQKKKSKQSFEPELLIATSSDRDHVIIKVRDNGNGIPVHVKEKIFEPFFTTKPTGKGTGLGLSISYDIIKAHGGEMNFESKENEFTEFVIQLPCSV